MRRRSISAAFSLSALLAGCGHADSPDPCDQAHFNQQACQDAVARKGYYSRGTFVPHVYSQPYPFYYSQFGAFRSSGGRNRPAASSAYSAPATGGVARGGFGSTGEGGGE